MRIHVRLSNHGYVDGVHHEGGEVIEIDEKQYSETWMHRVDAVPEQKPKGIIKRLFGKA